MTLLPLDCARCGLTRHEGQEPGTYGHPWVVRCTRCLTSTTRPFEELPTQAEMWLDPERRRVPFDRLRRSVSRSAKVGGHRLQPWRYFVHTRDADPWSARIEVWYRKCTDCWQMVRLVDDRSGILAVFEPGACEFLPRPS